MVPRVRRQEEPLSSPGVVQAPTSSLPNDEALVARAMSGERWAESALYARHAPEVLLLATRLLRQRAEAEDVVQETFFYALTELERLRMPSAFRLWVLRIAVRRVHRRFRRRTWRRWIGWPRDEATLPLEAQVAPGASPEQVAELALVDRRLDLLTTDERIAWTLRYVQGARLMEVAVACDCSLATVKRRLLRAQRRLGLELEEPTDD